MTKENEGDYPKKRKRAAAYLFRKKPHALTKLSKRKEL